MGIIRVLKRKDGASLVVGVTLAFFTAQMVTAIAEAINRKIEWNGSFDGGTLPGSSSTFKADFLQPIVLYLISVLILELLVWLYVSIHSSIDGKK